MKREEEINQRRDCINIIKGNSYIERPEQESKLMVEDCIGNEDD